MRENSGKGDSNTGLLDPTMKEHEAERGRSGQAPLGEKGTQAHGGDVQPPNSDDAGVPRTPETGEPETH
jgi:hypothetical protein